MLAAIVFVGGALLHGAESAPEKGIPRAAPALVAAMQSSLAYCRQAARGGDFKSLARGANGMTVLVELLRAENAEDAWQTAAAEAAKTNRAILESARNGDAPAAAAALDRLAGQLPSFAEKNSAAKPASLGKAPGGLHNLMYVLEATLADAKTAVAVDDLAAARQSAVVLSALDRLVSNERTDARWQHWASDYQSAAELAIRSETDNARSFRPLLHAVSQRCEACHDKK
ncbi:MAG TPA: hypothetical protein VFE24_00155 [Pirellulales bacterium]|nr:hypothetical protein [Pirellulales bacterium]